MGNILLLLNDLYLQGEDHEKLYNTLFDHRDRLRYRIRLLDENPFTTKRPSGVNRGTLIGSYRHCRFDWETFE